MQWKNSEQQLSLQMILFLSKNEKKMSDILIHFLSNVGAGLYVTKKLECLYKI